MNETKGSLARIKTPLTFVLLFLVLYILSHDYVDSLLVKFPLLDHLVAPIEFLFWLLIITSLTYTLIKLSGMQNDLLKQGVRQVDNVAERVWEHGLGKVADRASRAGMHLLASSATAKLKTN